MRSPRDCQLYPGIPKADEGELPTEPTPEEIQAFAETLDRYAVAEELLRLKYHLDHVGDITGANSRTAALAALLGLIKFITRAIPGYQVPPASVTVLHLALSDLDDGKVHPLLKKRADVKGQPVSTESCLVRACAAAAMDCLMHSGFKSDEAATLVGRELLKLKIKVGDRRSTSIAKSVKNWRWGAMGRDPKSDLDAHVYNELRAMCRPSANPTLDREKIVEGLAEDLRNLGVIA